MFNFRRRFLITLATLVVCTALTSCGGGGGTGNSATYSIGGQVSGLSGTGLVLQDLGSDSLAVPENGSFTFRTAVAATGIYSVTVAAQPSVPFQTCTTANGAGITNATVDSVLVHCTGGGTANTWTLQSGDNSANESGAYGTQGIADPVLPAHPGGRRAGAVSWTDARGNLWLFGGYGYDKNGTQSYLNDLWEFSGGLWTWVRGSSDNSTAQAGVYGVLNTASATSIPGAREQSVSWVDASGNLWLFGGYGYGSDATMGTGYLNDLWEFTGGNWIWRGGANSINQAGVYGALGAAALTNTPSARSNSIVWMDYISGSLWLFGGRDYTSTSTPNELNDLWKYSGGQWALISGDNGVNHLGVYSASESTPAVPGARESAAGWIDSTGALWLFGGFGYNSTTSGYLNDLWKYSGGAWIAVSGDRPVNQNGVYGTQGTSAVGNVPGARNTASIWKDAAGVVWLFGGYGYGTSTGSGYLNDLWKYDSTNAVWTWVTGDTFSQSGAYVASANDPGARRTGSRWIDVRTGMLWVFGGEGYTSTGQFGFLNDLWSYTP